MNDAELYDAELYDVVIVGGGVVGATLACALGGSTLRVAVLEAQTAMPAWSEQDNELRVSALSAGSVQVFRNLGAWQGMSARRVSPFREMHVWDARGTGLIHFDSADIAADTLGYIVENQVIQTALYERAQQFANITWLNSARIAALERAVDQVMLRTEDGRVLHSRLLVGADGPTSKVRQLTGIASHGWDYQQTALVATVRTSYVHRETAWQRFLAEGPLAFLPLADGHRSSIVWSLPPARAAALLALDEAAFITELQHALGPPTTINGVPYSLGLIESVGPRACFPLKLSHARHYVQPGVALIGDAAHTVHPLAGQGLNLGIADAAVLAEVLLAAQAQGRDMAVMPVLRRYERWRRTENLSVVAALEAIKRLFGNPFPPLGWLRNTGLSWVDHAHPLKNHIMQRAMGMSGDIPGLAREPVERI